MSESDTELSDLTPYFKREPGAVRQPERECVECEGDLWSYGYDMVCANCHAVAGSGTDSEPTVRPDPTDESWPTYNGTDNPVLYGAFLHAHDWGGDHADPSSFYE